MKNSSELFQKLKLLDEFYHHNVHPTKYERIAKAVGTIKKHTMEQWLQALEQEAQQIEAQKELAENEKIQVPK